MHHHQLATAPGVRQGQKGELSLAICHVTTHTLKKKIRANFFFLS